MVIFLLLICVSVCVCVQVYACVCAGTSVGGMQVYACGSVPHVCMHAYGGQRMTLTVGPQLEFTLFLKLRK